MLAARRSGRRPKGWPVISNTPEESVRKRVWEASVTRCRKKLATLASAEAEARASSALTE